MLRHAACRDGKVHKLLTSCTVDACSMVQSSVEKLLQMFVFDILDDLGLRAVVVPAREVVAARVALAVAPHGLHARLRAVLGVAAVRLALRRAVPAPQRGRG